CWRCAASISSIALSKPSSGFSSSRLRSNGMFSPQRLERLERLEPWERSLIPRHRQLVRSFAEPSAAAFCHRHRVAPLADIFAVGGNRRRLADENHVLAHRHGELLGTSG